MAGGMFHRAGKSSIDTESSSKVFDLPASAYWHTILSESVVSGLVGAMDALVAALVGGLLYWAYVGWSPENYQIYLAVIGLNVVLTVGALQYSRLYDFERVIAWPRHMSRAVVICGFVFLVLVALAFALKLTDEFSRLWFFASFMGTAVMICACRGLFRYFLGRSARAGLMARNVAIVGAGGQARYLLGELRERDVPWKRIVGVFDDRKTRIDSEVNGFPVLGDLDDLVGYVRRGMVHDVVITLPWNADDRLVSIIDRLRHLPVHVYLGSDLIGYHFPRHHRRQLEGVPVLEIAAVPLSGWSGVIKVVEDKILAVLALAVLSPLLLLIALAIKLDSRGPVLFRQARYGFNNEVIIVNKFRTMYHDRPPEVGVPQARRNDLRVTRVGRLLRRMSFDELPQVLNVLSGSMSMVGPRPHAVEHNEQYSALIGGYHGRHRVKPGITGWAQVNGLRGETTTLDQMRKRVEHDIHYIENWSPWLDLRIVVLTALFGWHQKNAY
ncbi:MAG: undecaprenyl-phosphate glucose phosphotransferase, partial [Xanthomonadales bacterium]|jgi:Undecaprenyl-phosphate glucose phosphotransferase|nr:undecaprenyl-phosphate glucose phosphotransferase [Xanthomonadales bacterium]